MKNFTLPLIAASALALSACGDNAEVDNSAPTDAELAVDGDTLAGATIADLAGENPDLSTLATAVGAADLAETLSGPGPFTVFAPNNAAFDALPAGTLDTLTQPENKETLAGILKYHVVEGETMAAALQQLIADGDGSATLTTVAGGELTAAITGENVTLTDAAGNSATVLAADVDASNGVVHVIDAVLMPE